MRRGLGCGVEGYERQIEKGFVVLGVDSRHKEKNEKNNKVEWRITRHTSHVTCHTSHVTRHAANLEFDAYKSPPNPTERLLLYLDKNKAENR